MELYFPRPLWYSKVRAGPAEGRGFGHEGQGPLGAPVPFEIWGRTLRMVLSIMRRHAKSWIIKFLIAIIAIVFVFYFGYSFTAQQGLKVAYVNGDLITGSEYQKAYRDLLVAFQNQYKAAWNDAMAESLGVKKMALTNLVNQRLMNQEARRLGLEVTEEEVQKAILNFPAFQSDGRFDLRRYKGLLSQNHMETEDFEKAMAHDLLEKKLRQFLFAFLDVTDEEVRTYYRFFNEKIRISVVQFPVSEYTKAVTWDREALEKYFAEHKETYRIPEKIKAVAIVLDPFTYREAVKITDQEVRAQYEDNVAAYKDPKKMRLRNILLKVAGATKEAEEAVMGKARGLLEEARKGGSFAELAKRHSEGPNKDQGGDLGLLSPDQMDPLFRKATADLKKGEISEPVRNAMGINLIYVEEIQEERQKPFEDVKASVREGLVKRATAEMAHEKGLALIDQMPYEVDLGAYAAQHGIATQVTDAFSREESVPGIGGTRGLSDSLFSLEKGETTELVEVGGKYCIFQVAERLGSYLPELKDIEDRVKQDLIKARAGDLARQDAAGYLAEARGGKAWTALAQERKKKVEEAQAFSRQGSIPFMGYAPDLSDRLFAMGKDAPYPEEPYSNETASFVYRWEGTEEPDPKRFEEEKDRYRQGLIDTKHRQVFESWMEDLRKQAQIEVLTPVTGG